MPRNDFNNPVPLGVMTPTTRVTSPFLLSDTLVREPKLLIPRQKPIGNVRVEGIRPIFRQFSAIFLMYGSAVKDIISMKPATSTGIRSGAGVSYGNTQSCSVVVYGKKYSTRGASCIAHLRWISGERNICQIVNSGGIYFAITSDGTPRITIPDQGDFDADFTCPQNKDFVLGYSYDDLGAGFIATSDGDLYEDEFPGSYGAPSDFDADLYAPSTHASSGSLILYSLLFISSPISKTDLLRLVNSPYEFCVPA